MKLTSRGDGKMRRQNSRWLISPHGAFHCVSYAMPPVHVGATQNHVFVLTPCLEITSKLLAPSVGLVLDPLHTHSHHLRLCVCCCSHRRGNKNQGGAVRATSSNVANNIQVHMTWVLRVMTCIMREESEGRDEGEIYSTIMLAFTACLNKVRPTLDTCNWTESAR